MAATDVLQVEALTHELTDLQRQAVDKAVLEAAEQAWHEAEARAQVRQRCPCCLNGMLYRCCTFLLRTLMLPPPIQQERCLLSQANELREPSALMGLCGLWSETRKRKE
jgi:hypothetical protein